MSPMMIEAGWSETYIIGYEAIDVQHEELFRLCEDIFSSTDDAVIENKFISFKESMKLHFNQEDILMKFIEYPDLEAHTLLHDELARKMETMSIRSMADFPALVDFVKTGMVTHVKDHDMKIAEFRNQYNLEIETQPAPLYEL